MRPQLLMACTLIFILGTLLALICSGRWLLNGEIDIVNALASFNTMSVQAGGVWNAPKTLQTFWDATITMFSWNYPFFESGWTIFVQIPLWVISIGTIWGILQVFASIIQGLVGMVRAFLPGG